MTTKVEFYSTLREVTGDSEIEVSLPEDSTVEALLDVLYAKYPALAAWDSRMVVAANLDYVERAHSIRPGEIFSVMPPAQDAQDCHG